MDDGLSSFVVTGPFMPEDAQRRLRAVAPESVTVTPFLPGLDDVIAVADVVVSMAGYNTVCELLGSGTPAVLVPRVGHREEQRMRAARLANLGLVEHVPPAAIEPRGLAAAVRRALGRGRRHCVEPRLDGLDRVAREVSRLLPLSTGSRTADTPKTRPAAELSLEGVRA